MWRRSAQRMDGSTRRPSGIDSPGVTSEPLTLLYSNVLKLFNAQAFSCISYVGIGLVSETNTLQHRCMRRRDWRMQAWQGGGLWKFSRLVPSTQ